MQPEGPSDDAWIPKRFPDRPLPATREKRIGMEKHDDVAFALSKTGLKLSGAASSGLEHPGTGRTRPLSCRVSTSSVDDPDHHAACPAGRGTRDRILNSFGLVERGYHHRDIHDEHSSMPIRFPFGHPIAE